MTTQTALINMLNRAMRGPKPADVLFIALGLLRGDNILDALRKVSQDTLIILVAGNDGKSEQLLAASQANIVCIGALEGAHRAPYSNFGPDVDLFAPGLFSTRPYNRQAIDRDQRDMGEDPGHAFTCRDSPIRLLLLFSVRARGSPRSATVNGLP